MSKHFATIILAGGRGTRMGSTEKHKVCFAVLGVPVIIRAIETYNLCGSQLNIVVVGMLAENVMTTINQRFSGVAYAFQEQQRGTGDAARKGAHILEHLDFDGDVLVVAGDKVIQPRAIRKLIELHRRSKADATIATARRPPHSSAGILLQSSRGNIAGILEESERQRLVGIAWLENAAASKALSFSQAEKELLTRIPEKVTQKILGEAWRDLAEEQTLTPELMQRQFTPHERAGVVRVGEESFPAGTLLERFNQMNLSTYVFRAPVLYDALNQLTPRRENQEEYFTDLFEILSRRAKPARVVGCEIEDTRELMAFNNPQELLTIEEVYRQQNGAQAAHPVDSQRLLATPDQWSRMFSAPSPGARRQLAECYGSDIPLPDLAAAVDAFVNRFGTSRPVSVIRSPGRINLMGRHIDHQGGTVNVMAINREILVVAAPRTDDLVTLANSDGRHFNEQTFRISDMIARLNWDDWQNVVDGPRIHRMLENARGDWANYVKAAILRLQEQFRDRQLKGLDMMVSGQIPMGAGLSSSSALVVATAEAVRHFNDLPVSAKRLVSLCGEGEWFVGTRGGAADHAAIKLSRRGCVTRVGFFPFHLEDSAEFFSNHDLLVCNSGLYAGKSSHARNTFNAKVTAYHVGVAWFKTLRPELADRIHHLRDLTPEHLGISRKVLAETLLQLPARVTRPQVLAAFTQFAEHDRATISRLFGTHDAPSGGYDVRGVVLFGLSEMARARRCLQLLADGDAHSLGKLMNVSHDGDRVSVPTKSGIWQRRSTDMPGNGSRQPTANDLMRLESLPGSYRCSLPELDRIADLAKKLRGVEGAQLAGAGLGGCVMVLVQREHSDDVRLALATKAIRAEVFRPIAGASSLSLA